jgi:hypothetical protein
MDLDYLKNWLFNTGSADGPGFFLTSKYSVPGLQMGPGFWIFSIGSAEVLGFSLTSGYLVPGGPWILSNFWIFSTGPGVALDSIKLQDIQYLIWALDYIKLLDI